MTKRNRLRVEVNGQENALFVRTGAFLEHPESRLVVPRKFTLPFSRWSNQMYFMFSVTSGTFTLTTPYDHAEIVGHRIESGNRMYVKLAHVLAFSQSNFFQRVWKIDVTSILTSQLRYICIDGPSMVYLFGLGGVAVEELCGEKRDFDPGCLIAWSGTVRTGVSTRSSILSALLSKEQVLLDRVEGNGSIMTQASTLTKLPRRFHDEQSNASFIDYLNALLGLRI